MTRFKAVVAYNGSQYHGWQTQQKGNSIQEQIELVLKTIQKEDCEISASGRTDAKVHALGQVFHFDSHINMEGNAYVKAMNALLPKDIRMQSVIAVHDDFHARFDACSKRYDYYLSSDANNPFIQNFMGIEKKVLDVKAMQACAKVFIGTHDFTTFTSTKIHPEKSRIKTITRAEVIEEGNVLHFILEGDGFLRYMVRMLVATIIEVGKHTITKQEVADMLAQKDKHLCRFKADPQGLYLVSVKYEN